MKKIIGILIALIVVAAAALPAVVGPATERQIRQGVADFSARHAFYDVAITNYERYYRRATATLKVRLTEDFIEAAIAKGFDDRAPMTAQEKDELFSEVRSYVPLQVEIEHGPVVTSFAKGLGLNSFRIRLGYTKRWAKLREIRGLEDPLEVVGKTALNGNARFALTIPEMHLAFTDAVEFRFSGLTGSGTWENGAQRLVMEARNDKTTIFREKENIEFALRDIDFDIGADFASSSVGVGRFSFNVRRMNVTGRRRVTWSNFGLDSEIRTNDNADLLDLRLVYRLDEIAENSDPGAITDATAVFELIGITPELWLEYRKAAVDLAQPEPLIDAIYETLAASPTLNVGPVKFKVDDQIFDGALSATFDGATLPPAASFNALDKRMWMGAITQRLDVTAAEGLLNGAVEIYLKLQAEKSMALSPDSEVAASVEQQRAELLEQLADQDMITRTDDGYVIDADYDKGELTLNGKPFPIEALLAP